MNYKKFIFIISFLAILGFLFNSIPIVKAMTIAEIKVLIQQLQQQIVQLQQQLSKIQKQPEVWCHNFNVNLKIGDKGNDINALEYVLAKEGFSVTEHGSNFPAIFDERMASAVVGFQEKYKKEILAPWGLTHGTGYVGKTTRAKLNELYGCTRPSPQTPTTPSPSTTPSIEVLSPSPKGVPGGLDIKSGSIYVIRWNSSNVNKVKLYLCNYSGNCTFLVRENASLGYYNWYVDPNHPYFPGSNLRIKIVDEEQPTIHAYSGYFAVGITSITPASAPSITSVSPNSGTSNDTITIYGKNLVDTIPSGIKIELSLKFQLSGILVENSTPGTYQIRVVNDNGKSNTLNFTIVAPPTEPSINITSPNGGEQWTLGTPHTITWKSTGIDRVAIYLNFSDGSVCKLASNISSELGKYTVTLKENQWCPEVYKSIKPGQYKIAIWKDTNIKDISVPHDSSDNYFTIVAPLSTSAPSIKFIAGKTYPISWKSTDVSNIDISICGPTPLLPTKYTCWKLVRVNAYLGNYYWTIDPNAPYVPGEDLKIRLTNTENPDIYDESDSSFIIVEQYVPVLSINKYTYYPGEAPVYQIQYAKPNTYIYWSSTKNGVSTGETMSGYGHITDSNGNFTVTGGVWTSNDVGTWTKWATIDGKESNRVTFTVKSGTSSSLQPSISRQLANVSEAVSRLVEELKKILNK